MKIKPDIMLGLRSVLILFLVLVAGCIAPEIEKGNPAEYELPGLDNTTIFYLNVSSVQVVGNVINSTSVDFIIPNNAELNFRDPVAVDHSGNNVTFNVSTQLIFGKRYARFDFNSPFSGFVAFTQSGGQDFTFPLIKNGTIRVVLPVDYTANSMFLGVAQPEPDNITKDTLAREVLIWDNPYPEHESILVKFHHKNTPTLLFYFLFSLFILSVLVLGYYYFNLSALKKKRTLMEKDIKK
jgi:hypothetical protein